MGQLFYENPLDLLTDDFFISEILSRLSTLKSIVRLSSVSTTLHTLCRYAPVIEFGEITDAIINYLDQFFAFRMNSNIKYEFRRFRFCMRDMKYIRSFNVHLLIRWFDEALCLNVQELILQVEQQATPYRYHDIASLKLHSYPSKHLRVLTLQNIPIGLDRSFEVWVSTCCISLEELRLKGVFVLPSKLKITSSSLRVFTINAQFKHLRVSVPKLVTLHVMWNLLCLGRRDRSLRVLSASNLQDFVLKNWDAPITLDYFSSGDERINFPCLKSASLEFSGIANIPLYSLKRILLDISQTRYLRLSETILHKIWHNGMIHLATSFEKLEVLDVRVSGDSSWRKQTRLVMSFVKTIPSLKTFKLTIDYQGLWDIGRNHNSHTFRKSLVPNILNFGISRPAVYLRDNKVKVELSRGEDETLLVQHIIKEAPIDMQFIFSYPS